MSEAYYPDNNCNNDYEEECNIGVVIDQSWVKTGIAYPNIITEEID